MRAMFRQLNIRKRISSRVMIGLMVLALVTVLSSGLAVFAFDHLRKGHRVVRQEKIPGLIGASRLIRESEQLVSRAPDIMVARNRYIRSLLAHGIDEKAGRMEELIAPLAGAGIDKSLLESLSRQFELLFAGLKELIELANSLEEMETRTRQINTRLHRISGSANSLKIPLPPGGGAGFSGGFDGAFTSSNTFDEAVLLFKAYVRSLTSINQAVADLLSLQSVNNLTVLTSIENQFNSHMGQFTSHMGRVALQTPSNFRGFSRKMKSIEEEIIKYGTGEGNLFHHRERQIDLRLKVEGNLVDNKFLSDRLVHTVSGIFTLIQSDIEAQNRRFDRQIKGFTNLLFIIPLVGVLSAVVIFFYIRSSVVGRILSLKEYMEKNVTGRSRGVPVRGSDEIADMVRSVNFFIAEIEKRERNLENAVMEMERAKDAAEAANRAKSVFLANMSHELRTPLNAILGFSRLLARGRNLDSSQRKNLSTITSSGEHLLMVINDVLAMSKIEAGRSVLSEQNFDLYHLLDDIKEMFRLRVSEKGLQLFCELDPDLPRYVRADEIKLRQVLINLLNNALKFTSEGGISLRVKNGTGEPVPGEKSSIRFEVEDTGIGISENELENIFEAFAQAGTLHGEEEGTGLGLPISHRFVELMGGSLSARSHEKKGSLFSFYIHVGVVAKSDIREKETVRRVIGLAPDQPLYRVLVVDDNMENRRLLISMLNPLGFDLCQASNGREALAMAEKHKPHLIFMDMRMPVMDGRAATRAIKSLPGAEDTIVIAVTASVFEEEREEVLSFGCDDFLRKPFRETDVFSMLAKHLELRFIYEDEGKTERADKGEGRGEKVTPEALSRIPSGLLAKLSRAAAGAEMDLLVNHIEEIRKLDPMLAEGLEGLADEFSYDKIRDLIRQSGDLR